MFILNRYNVTTPAAAAAVGAVVNVNPNVVTGATGDSAGGDSVTPIVANAGANSGKNGINPADPLLTISATFATLLKNLGAFCSAFLK